jgi:hypothetical protein
VDDTAVTPTVERDEEAELAREEFLVRFHRNTLTAYTGDLDAWFAWCAQQPVPVLGVKRIHIERYASWMEETKQCSACSGCAAPRRCR